MPTARPDLTETTVRYLFAPRWRDAEPELSTAVASDCLRTIADRFSPGGGDNL